MIAILVALSVALRVLVFGGLMYSDRDLGWTLRHWLSPFAMAATILFMGAAAICGAAAAPGMAADEEIQAAHLAGISPTALCAGRLLAALRLPVAALMISALCWLLAQAAAHVVPPEQGGFGAILLAHVILACALFMAGAVAFAFQAGARGRSWGGGVAAGLLLTAALVAAPFLVNSRVQAMEDPSRLLAILLLLNPVFAVESALGRDILHAPWVYARTTAADYLVDTPPPPASAGVFLIIGLAAFALAAWRLRAAFRR